MTVNEFFEQADKNSTYAVKLAYRHSPSEKYTVSVEICEYCVGYDYIGWVWFNDWNEGEDDVVVLNYVDLDKLMEGGDLL